MWGLFFAMEKTTVVIFSELTAILLKSKQSPSVFKDLNFALGDFEALSCQDQTYQAQHHGGTQQEPTCPGDTSRVSGCQEVKQSKESKAMIVFSKLKQKKNFKKKKNIS